MLHTGTHRKAAAFLGTWMCVCGVSVCGVVAEFVGLWQVSVFGASLCATLCVLGVVMCMSAIFMCQGIDDAGIMFVVCNCGVFVN